MGTRIARYRNDSAGTHGGQLLDQLWSDVAGRPDDQVAAVWIEWLGPGRGPMRPLQARDTAHACAIDNLVLSIAVVSFCQHPARGELSGHRLVDIDDAAPDLGVLQRQCSTRTPQRRVGRVGPIARTDGLRITSQHEELGRRRPIVGGCSELARRFKQAVSQIAIETTRHVGGVEHMRDSREGVRDGGGIFGRRRWRQYCDRSMLAEQTTDFRAEVSIGNHQPTAIRVVWWIRRQANRPGQLAVPLRGNHPARLRAQRIAECDSIDTPQRPDVDPVTGVVQGVVGRTVCGSGSCSVCGGWVVWVALRLVWNVIVSSVSRARVPMLWWCVTASKVSLMGWAIVACGLISMKVAWSWAAAAWSG